MFSSSLFGSTRRKRFVSQRSKAKRRTLLERLEGRQMLAADGFMESLPTADEVSSDAVVNDEGRPICLAFLSSEGSAEGELAAPPVAPAPGDVDLAVAITNQPAGPLLRGAAFNSTITFTNSGVGDADTADLIVNFDSKLSGVTWEREIVRSQADVVSVDDFDGTNGFSMQGAAIADLTGFSVSGGGDVNNDGIDDIIIGAIEGRVGADAGGEVYVVFGTDTGFPADIDLAALNGTDGFRISGVDPGGELGVSVDIVDDINDDDIDDIIIGAAKADGPAGTDSGQVVVVFGSASPFAQVIQVDALGSSGFIINGLNAEDQLGTSVASAGDINGDNIGDIIISAPQKLNIDPSDSEEYASGAAYVILGSSSLSPLATFDLSALNGTNGFAIEASDFVDRILGASVSGAGDVNNDGTDDVILGAPGDLGSLGEVFVVFGSDTGFASGSVDISSLGGTTGFAIGGIRADHQLGIQVSRLGDVNGDDIDDLIVADTPSETTPIVAARSYVVYGATNLGSTGSVDLGTLNASTGLLIDAPDADHPGLMYVSDVGDVNGDSVNDILVGLAATVVDPGEVTEVQYEGGAYLVYGSDSFASSIGLGTVDGTNGFLIEGSNVDDLAGEAVGAAGDVNGDGLADIIVGAFFADLLAGESYVYFGRGSTFDNGAGSIDDDILVGPGDEVIYRVSATIANDATDSTVVNASAAHVDDTTPGNNTATATTLIQAPAPLVVGVTINDGGPSRSMITSLTVEFDSIIDPAGLPTAFVITNVDTSTQVTDLVVSAPDNSGGTSVVTLTFDDDDSNDPTIVRRVGVGVLDDSLADGNYRLDILASGIQSGGVSMVDDFEFGGQTFGESPNDDFYRLLGEVNQDGVRNNTDLATVVPTLFNPAGYRADLDTNGDGVSNNTDLAALVPTLFGPSRL